MAAARDWVRALFTEPDEGFRQELLSLAHRGIPVTAAAEGVAGAIALAGLMPWPIAVLLCGLGGATYAAGRTSALYAYNRPIAAASCALAAMAAALSSSASQSQDFSLGVIAILLVMTAAAVPLLPVQTICIGLLTVTAASRSTHAVFVALIAAASIAMAALLNAQRRSHYESYVGLLNATEEFRALESRLRLAENSATLFRLSAALAHELSSPIGTVTSGVETLLTVCARQAEAPPGEQKRFVALQTDLGRSLRSSLARLKGIVNRFQRLTNLDEAATAKANLNDLVHEAVDLVQAEFPGGAKVRLELQELPEIECRPQQIIAVLTNVLMNSIQAVNGDAGLIRVSTAADINRLEIRIDDNGRGIPPEQLEHIFDPGFQVEDGRVSTGNWTMFVSRQFMKDHGGDMRIQSEMGHGTTVTLVLPC